MFKKNTAIATFTGLISNPVYVDNQTTCGVIIPNDTSFNSIALSVQVSTDGINFYNLYDDTGAQKTISIGADRAIFLYLGSYAGFAYIQFTASASLNGKAITVIFREIYCNGYLLLA